MVQKEFTKEGMEELSNTKLYIFIYFFISYTIGIIAVKKVERDKSSHLHLHDILMDIFNPYNSAKYNGD